MEEKINVLHVDDESTFLKLTEKYLGVIGGEELNYYSLSDPLKVFDELKKRAYDVIVTDYQMPQMDGLKLLRILRDQENTIPIIIFTGRGREEVAINALNLGANYYIDKGGDPRSQFSELLHVIRQVVHHRRIEDALKESEERYRIIFDESPISLWEEDFSAVKDYFDHLKSQGVEDLRQYLNDNPHETEKLTQMVKIESVNSTTLKLYNAKNKSEFYEGLPLFFDEDASVIFEEELIALFNGETVYQNEFPGYKLTGEKIEVIVRLSVISGYEDTLSKVIVSVIDITELKRAQEELKRSEGRYRRLIDLSPDAILLSDLESNIIMVNQQAISLYGATNEEELIGKNAFDFIIEEDHPRAKLNLKEILETGSIRNIQYLMIKKDGSVFPAELSAAAIFDKKNHPTSLIGVIRDITERKRAEEKLRRQKEELSDFAHFIAHDVSNCLTTIEGYTQLLDLEYDETHIISKQIEYMKNLLIRSLMLADAGLAVDKTEVTDLNMLVRRISETTIPKEIEFSHDDLPTVLCDEEKLAQVFKNLFENAVIHGKPQKIEIGFTKNERLMTILINNDGQPIHENIKDKIFDYGFTTLKDSMGLGLSIVRKMVEAHGWNINLQSNDQNTSFQITIPLDLHENNLINAKDS